MRKILLPLVLATLILGGFFVFSNQRSSNNKSTGTSTPVFSNCSLNNCPFEIYAEDSGKVFTYSVTSRFTVFLDPNKFPPKELKCDPEGIIGYVSNVPAAFNGLTPSRFEGVQEGTCNLKDRDFNVTIKIQNLNDSASTSTNEASLHILPGNIEQGDPALVTIDGVGFTQIKSLTLEGAALPLISYKEEPAALLGIDLKKTAGEYPLTLNLTNGTQIKKNLIVGKRYIAEAPLGIPDSLGGNTPQAEQDLLATLAKENAEINSLKSTDKQLWSGSFRYPLNGEITVTDPYGYSRLTGDSTISHKGVDFRADVGTPVYAMNAGRVLVAKTYTDYGNTIIIDHGLGLMSLYMHLSELEVKPGDMVEKGKEIGKSGQTGYAEGPHLHISIKIGGSSIDPIKFLNLFPS